MFCPKCGKQIDDDSVFCEYCGENVEITPADPFQTVYADDNTYDNNDYTDNYADDYNNAYPANFTEPQPMPMPSPAPEKSSKKMIAAVCAVCSVMLVLMAVLCAKVIFGGKKIQTDSSSSRPVKAAGIAVAEDSSSVIIAEESSVAETAVTTAATTVATTAPKAESSSQGEKKVKKKALSGIELSDMTVKEIRDYVGDDFRPIFYDCVMDQTGYGHYGITSDKYFKNIIIGSYTFSTDGFEYRFADEEEKNERLKITYSDFCSGNYDNEYPSILVIEDGLIGYDLYGEKINAGCDYKGLLKRIDCLTGIDIYGNSFSIIQGHDVALYTMYFDNSLVGNEIYYPYNMDLSVNKAIINGKTADLISKNSDIYQPAQISKNNTPLMNAKYDYDKNNPNSEILLYINKGEDIYVNKYDSDGWNQIYYKWKTDNGFQWKRGYVRSEYIDWSW